MRMLGCIALGALIGALLAIAVTVAAAYAFDISQAEGAYAMGVAFFYAPAGLLLGAIVGGLMAPKRRAG